MTTTIDPGDTGALHDVFTDHADYEAPDMYPALVAVARAVCPTDCVVVRRDDLLRVCDLSQSMTCDDLVPEDAALVLSLRNLAGETDADRQAKLDAAYAEGLQRRNEFLQKQKDRGW